MPAVGGEHDGLPRASTTPPARIIAVDWSGARLRAERRIWLAEWRADREQVVRLEDGRTRDAIIEHLCRELQRDPNVVIGLDFAFSFPAWFLETHALAHAPAAWSLVQREGERWLADCPPPFWGRPGRPRPVLPEHFRRTERQLPGIAGIRPKSVLQLGGAGAVGTGSLRGMPYLSRLRAAGCAVWPFDPPRLPMVVEIYPRLLTGPVTKSSASARRRWLAERAPTLPRSMETRAGDSDDAFDALASALAMGRYAGTFPMLNDASDAIASLEGEIWRPPATPPLPRDRQP